MSEPAAPSTWMFVRDVLRRPGQMGAVAPSGPALAKCIVEEARIGPGHAVAELGAGTGVFTREIAARHPDAPLVVFEPGEELAAAIQAQIPAAHVTTRLADALPEVLDGLGIDRVDRVVSGLPWAIFPLEVQTAILDAVVSRMPADGRIVTFQYLHSQVMPGAAVLRRLLEERFTTITRSAPVWANLPPAFVIGAEGPKNPGRPR